MVIRANEALPTFQLQPNSVDDMSVSFCWLPCTTLERKGLDDCMHWPLKNIVVLTSWQRVENVRATQHPEHLGPAPAA